VSGATARARAEPAGETEQRHTKLAVVEVTFGGASAPARRAAPPPPPHQAQGRRARGAPRREEGRQDPVAAALVPRGERGGGRRTVGIRPPLPWSITVREEGGGPPGSDRRRHGPTCAMVFRGERGRSRAPKRERVVGTGGGRKVKKREKKLIYGSHRPVRELHIEYDSCGEIDIEWRILMLRIEYFFRE